MSEPSDTGTETVTVDRREYDLLRERDTSALAAIQTCHQKTQETWRLYTTQQAAIQRLHYHYAAWRENKCPCEICQACRTFADELARLLAES